MDNLPFNTNINWTVLIGVLFSVLALFGFNVPDSIRADIVTLISVGTAVIVWVLHTFINPPKNKAAFHAAVGRALTSAKRAAPALLVGILLLGGGFGLSGCAGGSIFGGSASTVATTAGDTLVVFNGSQIWYISTCLNGSATAPALCRTNKAAFKKGSADGTAALATVVAAIELNTADPASIQNLLNQAIADVATFQSTANVAKASTGKKGDLLTTITIGEQVIAVAMQIYTQIQQMHAAGTVSNAQLDALVTNAQKNDATIQAAP